MTLSLTFTFGHDRVPESFWATLDALLAYEFVAERAEKGCETVEAVVKTQNP